MKAVMYGAGNIGRGFIGTLFSESGYEVTFVDVAESVVEALKKNREYPVRYISNEKNEDVMIKNVTAVNGNDMDLVADAIADCDIMATAVGARILKFIVPNLVEGIRRRWKKSSQPLNIIICENLMDANKILESMLKEQMTQEECLKFDRTVGLVEASIGRMVPIQTEEMKDGNPLRVCVEKYGFLPTDKDAFVGKIPDIKGMVPFAPFDFYIKRKLYLHNMGHAICAYLGDILDLTYIYQAINVSEIRIIVENAMYESAVALSAKYGVELSLVYQHILDLLHRFTNSELQDTCARVGQDPARKLSPSDRLIGASKLVLETGSIPAYIGVGVAAAVHKYIELDVSKEQSVSEAVSVLKEVSDLQEESEFAELVLAYYTMILEKKPLSEIRKQADDVKSQQLKQVI